MRVNTHTMRGAMLALAGVSMIAILGQTPVYADTASQRLQESVNVLHEIMAVPGQSIPQSLLDQAECAIIIPNEKKGAFFVGGQYGRGFAVCRKPNGRGWGAPSAVLAEGGSFGFQFGGAETDVFMLVMGKDGMRHLLKNKFTIGGDVTAAAGPVGRNISAKSDASLAAKILTWSKSHGIFGGVSLNGVVVRNDLDTNKELYGKPLQNSDILMKNVRSPKEASELISVLNKLSPRQAGTTKAKPKG